jgi:hypothetical protein
LLNIFKMETIKNFFANFMKSSKIEITEFFIILALFCVDYSINQWEDFISCLAQNHMSLFWGFSKLARKIDATENIFTLQIMKRILTNDVFEWITKMIFGIYVN